MLFCLEEIYWLATRIKAQLIGEIITRSKTSIQISNSLTWIKRNGSATKLLGKPASEAVAQVTTGFATGHAALAFLQTPHFSIRSEQPPNVSQNQEEKSNSNLKSEVEEQGSRDTYGFYGFEGKGRFAVEDADGPGSLTVGAAAEGGGSGNGEGFGEGGEGDPGEEGGGGSEEKRGGDSKEEGGGAAAAPRNPIPPPWRSRHRRL